MDRMVAGPISWCTKVGAIGVASVFLLFEPVVGQSMAEGVPSKTVPNEGKSANSVANPPADHVGPGDRLSISVISEDTVTRVLSGEYRVESDGTINFPVLGVLPVAGMSGSEIAKVIQTSLGDQVPLSGPPTVSVLEYAPVFLLGDVNKVGSYPFEPEMTVFKLILRAGGIPQPPDDKVRLITAARDLSGLELTDFSLSVERARLIAELENRKFELSTVEDSRSGDRADIVAGQVAMFDAHQRAAESQKKSYEAQRRTYDQEISSLKNSIELQDEDVRLAEEQLKAQIRLASRGLTPESKVVELRRELASTKRRSLEYQTALFQAEQNRLGVEQKLEDVDIAADVATLESLSKLEVELEQTRVALDAAKRISEQVGPAPRAEETALGRHATYTLLRFEEGSGYKQRVVLESESLERGDILRVDVGPSRIDPAASTASATDGPRADAP